MQRPFLIGERLYLRAVELDDRDDLIRWVTHPDVRRTLARRHPLNGVAEERYIREVASKDGAVNLVVCLRDGDRGIGCIGLHDVHPVDRAATVGLAIGEPAEWDQGYGAEALGLVLDYAFWELNCHRVGLTVFAHNPRAIRCYEKVGFVREGALREAQFAEGRYVDTILMGVLQREWFERHPAD